MEPTNATLRAIASLRLPAAPTFSELVAAVEEQCGKRIRFHESTKAFLGKGITGCWYARPGVNDIYYLPGDRIWSLHVVLHELSHILLGHKAEKHESLVFGGAVQLVGRRLGLQRLCRPAKVPLTGREAEAENLAYALARLIYARPQGNPTTAERVFGL
ncbi:hypothetical protein ABIA52_000037 [Paenarthrobacter histidinolovorans]|uniref:IrrE N-terminal-like domain-containing protein n=1 Tax=Paenarthrobacter histidinolovorans TaxID=43664 RepID=A0ABW8N0M3_9MICC